MLNTSQLQHTAHQRLAALHHEAKTQRSINEHFLEKTRNKKMTLNKRLAFFLLLLISITLSACGSSPTLTTPALTGTWLNTNGSGKYELESNGNSLTGEAYYYDSSQAALVHVGKLTGKLEPNGEATWTVVLNDNGQTGQEETRGTFSGDSFIGTYVIRRLDGSIRLQGEQVMARDSGLNIRKVNHHD